MNKLSMDMRKLLEPFDTVPELREYFNEYGKINRINTSQTTLGSYRTDLLKLYAYDRHINEQHIVSSRRIGYSIATTQSFNYDQATLDIDGVTIRNMIVEKLDNNRGTNTIVIIKCNQIKTATRTMFLDYIKDNTGWTHNKAATMSLLENPRDKSFVLQNGTCVVYVTESLSKESELRFQAAAILLHGADILPNLTYVPLYVAIMQGADDDAPANYITPTLVDRLEVIIKEHQEKMFKHLNDYAMDNETALKNNITNSMGSLANLNAEYNRVVEVLNNHRAKLIAFTLGATDNPLAELAEYIQKNKIDTLVNLFTGDQSGPVFFVIKNNMTIELSVLESFNASGRSNDFKHMNEYNKQIMFEIAKGNLLCPVVGGMSINFKEGTYDMHQLNNYDTHKGSIVNLHWEKYSCIGNLHTPLVECLDNQSWLSMYELMVAAIGDVNASDGAVFPDFISRIRSGIYDDVLLTDKLGKKQTWRNWRSAFETTEEVPF